MDFTEHDLNDRKKKILKAIIDLYIACGEPVGSKLLSQYQDISLSSATIRNELADLTEMGYLTQPHASSGRVPSEQGYRFYVNTLMQSYDMTANEIKKLNEILAEKNKQLDQIIESAGKFVSTVTHYPAISVRTPLKQVIPKYINLVYVDEFTFLIIIMISENNIKTQKISSDVTLTPEVINELQSIVTSELSDTDVGKLTFSEIVSLENKFGSYSSLATKIIKSIHESVMEEDKSEIKFSGVDKFLEYPEFTEINKLKDVLGMVSEKDSLLSLVEKSTGNGVNILIGSENTADKNGESAVVFKTITVNGKSIGAIGVIGPTRMDYAKVVSTVEILSESLSKIMSEGDRQIRAPKEINLIGDAEHE